MSFSEGISCFVLHLLSAAALGLGAALLVLGLAEFSGQTAVEGGQRGLVRRRAVQRHALWRLAEPSVLALAAALQAACEDFRRPSRGERGNIHERLRLLLVRAGQPLGLDVWGLGALMCLSGAATFVSALVLRSALGTGAYQVPMTLVGFLAPLLRVHAMQTHRQLAAVRELPAAIELLVLAMSAGADFPGAVRRVAHLARGVVAEELNELLRALDLGISRAAALRAMQERLPIAEVRDVVRAVVLAERKGASVSDALSQVVASSRLRRTLRGEEAAARAGVLLLAPMMLLLCAILILLLGPMMLGGTGL